jgi:hypothetical protein
MMCLLQNYTIQYFSSSKMLSPTGIYKISDDLPSKSSKRINVSPAVLGGSFPPCSHRLMELSAQQSDILHVNDDGHFT